MARRNAQSDPLLGQTLDERFRLDRLLGKGGMGRVYEACQLSVDRRVAVKVVRDDFADQPIARKRFLREAKLISGFTHPNIVRLVDFGEDDERGLLYLAMDFVDGIALSQLLTSGPLRADVALKIVGQICGALTEAHSAGIVHRDLKPENILLTASADGSVTALVLDFGVALPHEVSIKITDTGMVCGTPAYMAPEQAKDREVGPAADLYGLGATLYEMLTGSLPVTADTPVAVMLKKIQEPAPSISDHPIAGAGFDDDLVALVDCLLERDPDLRPADAAELREMIAEVLSSGDFTLRTPPDATLLEAAHEWHSSLRMEEFVMAQTTPAEAIEGFEEPTPVTAHPNEAPTDVDAQPAETASKPSESEVTTAPAVTENVEQATSTSRIAFAVGLLLAVVVGAVGATQLLGNDGAEATDGTATADARPEPVAPTPAKVEDRQTEPGTTDPSPAIDEAGRIIDISRRAGDVDARAEAHAARERRAPKSSTDERPAPSPPGPEEQREKSLEEQIMANDPGARRE